MRQRDRIVGSSRPGEWHTARNRVFGGGSSRFFRKALAALRFRSSTASTTMTRQSDSAGVERKIDASGSPIEAVSLYKLIDRNPRARLAGLGIRLDRDGAEVEMAPGRDQPRGCRMLGVEVEPIVGARRIGFRARARAPMPRPPGQMLALPTPRVDPRAATRGAFFQNRRHSRTMRDCSDVADQRHAEQPAARSRSQISAATVEASSAVASINVDAIGVGGWPSARKAVGNPNVKIGYRRARSGRARRGVRRVPPRLSPRGDRG